MIVHFHKDLILEQLKKLKPKSVLDAGFAGGVGLEYYKENMPKVKFIGSDRDSHNVENFKARNKDIEVFEANAEKLPFKDNEFDIIVSDALMISTPNNIPLMAEELKRVAKKHIVFCEQHSEVNDGRAFDFTKYFPGIRFITQTKEWGDPAWNQYGWIMVWDK